MIRVHSNDTFPCLSRIFTPSWFNMMDIFPLQFTDASKELVHLQCPSRQRLERRLLLTAEHPAGRGPRRGRAVGSEASDLRFCVGTVGFCLQSYAGFLRRTRVTFLDLCATYAGEFGGLVPKASRSPLCNKPPAAG